jgi:formiminotetrahydrofolate cyclodeaminase
VKINASGLHDKAYVEKVLAEGNRLQESAMAMESEILSIVNSKIS